MLPPCLSIAAATRTARKKLDLRFTPCWRPQSSSVTSWMDVRQTSTPIGPTAFADPVDKLAVPADVTQIIANCDMATSCQRRDRIIRRGGRTPIGPMIGLLEVPYRRTQWERNNAAGCRKRVETARIARFESTINTPGSMQECWPNSARRSPTCRRRRRAGSSSTGSTRTSTASTGRSGS